jgi:hypothetical protein
MPLMTMIEILKLITSSTCPECRRFIQVESTQTDGKVITRGECKLCRMTYTVTRTQKIPMQVLDAIREEIP